MIYLIPPSSDLKDVREITDRAGVPMEAYGTLREMIIATQGKPLVIAMLSAQDMMVINRHASTLLDELPSVVMSVPGAVYTPEWMTLASALPAIDWKELAAKMSKSGHLSNTPEQLEKRGAGSNTFTVEEVVNLNPRLTKSPKNRRDQEIPVADDLDDEPDAV